MSNITVEELAKHITEEDCWILIGETVYDVTKFQNDHPGGKETIFSFAGKDATE